MTRGHIFVDVDVLREEIRRTNTDVSTDQEPDYIFPTGRAWARELGYPERYESDDPAEEAPAAQVGRLRTDRVTKRDLPRGLDSPRWRSRAAIFVPPQIDVQGHGPAKLPCRPRRRVGRPSCR
jgi:hypothetical protein